MVFLGVALLSVKTPGIPGGLGAWPQQRACSMSLTRLTSRVGRLGRVQALHFLRTSSGYALADDFLSF